MHSSYQTTGTGLRDVLISDLMALIFLALLICFIVGQGVRAIVKRVKRTMRQSAELERRRARATMIGRSDLELVRTVRRDLGHEASEREIYAACWERIRDSEGSDHPSLARASGLSKLIRSEITAPDRQATQGKAS